MELAPFNAVQSLLGGALIGLSSALLLLFNGRIAGMSSIFGGLFLLRGGRAWRLVFVLGLLGGAFAVSVVTPAKLGPPLSQAFWVLPLAGLLVGLGTRLGSGCTSGHGICGLARFSPRSLVATVTFIGSGAVTVVIIRALGGLP